MVQDVAGSNPVGRPKFHLPNEHLNRARRDETPLVVARRLGEKVGDPLLLAHTGALLPRGLDLVRAQRFRGQLTRVARCPQEPAARLLRSAS